jgi:hypothetical protein
MIRSPPGVAEDGWPGAGLILDPDAVVLGPPPNDVADRPPDERVGVGCDALALCL